jgi:ketol-acid reductoisomerase
MTIAGKAKKPTIAVIGYGSQGSAVAQNLRDSGYPVVLGLRSRSASKRKAKGDGFRRILSIPAAVAAADVVCFAFPDHLHARVFSSQIEPYLKRHAVLWFLHGLSIHFGLVRLPKDTLAILIAPHAPGLAVRESYRSDRSISGFYAVEGRGSREMKRLAFQLAGGLGIKRKNLLRTTFAEEAIGDIFGEQAVLCGGLAMLVKTGFEVLVGYGLKPEHAYLEVAYQLDLIVALMKKHGIAGMFDRVSPTARVGSLAAGPKIIDRGTKARMQQLLKTITSGQFVRQLNKLNDKQMAEVKEKLKKLTDHRLEKAARRFSR